MVSPEPFQVEGEAGTARRFFRKQDAKTQQILRDAVRKICENPHRDHRRYAIRHLQGAWDGYLEYRIQDPLLRIIYRVTDGRNRRIFIEEMTTRL